MRRNELTSRIRAIILSFMRTKPYIYATLAVHDVVIVRGLQGYAATDGTTLYIDADLAKKLDDARLALVLVHEALHAILLHPDRLEHIMRKGVPYQIANVAADAVVDYLMRGELGVGNDAIDENLVTVERVRELLLRAGVPHSVVERALANPSLERLAELLLEALKRLGVSYVVVCTDSYSRYEFMIPDDAKFVEKAWTRVGGERERREARKLAERGAARDAVRKMMELVKRIAQTSGHTVQRKKAGHGRGVFERLVDELTRVHVDAATLASIVAGSVGFNVRWTWSRLNKKLGESAPGRLRRGIDNIVIAIDVSGSISDDELRDLSSFAYSLVTRLHPTRVTVIHWDYGVQSVRVTSGSPAAVARVLKTPVSGGGGTSISEALAYAERHLRYGDVFVLCSDLFTLESPQEVTRRLERLKKRGVRIVVAVPESHNDEAYSALSRVSDLSVILASSHRGGVP